MNITAAETTAANLNFKTDTPRILFTLSYAENTSKIQGKTAPYGLGICEIRKQTYP